MENKRRADLSVYQLTYSLSNFKNQIACESLGLQPIERFISMLVLLTHWCCISAVGHRFGYVADSPRYGRTWFKNVLISGFTRVCGRNQKNSITTSWVTAYHALSRLTSIVKRPGLIRTFSAIKSDKVTAYAARKSQSVLSLDTHYLLSGFKADSDR